MSFEQQTRLRQDLVETRQETSEGISFIVKNPDNGRFFRLGEAEQFITHQLDGFTPLEAIRSRTEHKFGSSLPPETLRLFVDNLRRFGFLESEGPKPATPRGRVSGSVLYLRVRAFDPDRLFNRLIGSTRFFFTPHFLAFSGLVILLAAFVTAAGWGDISREIQRLYRFDALLLAWLTVCVVTTAHEFAHGLTCKHFGAEVHEVGFLLIYFQPAFYCNVSEAWLLPKKSQRLWITFAGGYFELFIWALATLVWRLVEPETWLSFFALVVMATSGIKTLFNVNPLIKLDGYYLLSDYLEVPNLRSRSLRYLRSLLRRLSPGSKSGDDIRASPRERRIYLVYGLLAGVYSCWLLGLVAISLGSFLTRRYQGLGLILFVTFMTVVFRAPLSRTTAPLTGVLVRRFQSLARAAKILKAGAFLAVLLGVLFIGRMELRVSSEFTILPAKNVEVRAEIEGIISEIYVDEGEVVAKGGAIARLSDRDQRAELQMIEATIGGKTAKLKMLEAGTRPEEIELVKRAAETAQARKEAAIHRFQEAERIHAESISKAEAGLAIAKERVKYAGTYLENSRLLFEGGLTSRQELDKAREEVAVREKEGDQVEAELKMVEADDRAEFKRALAVAEKELEEAQGRLRLLLAGSRPEEIEAMGAEISNSEVRRSYLKEQLRLVVVTSPISGVVATPKPKEKTGHLVTRGDLIVTVHELSSVTAEILSSEKEIADVRIGQDVELKARAYPLAGFHGKVTSIAPIASKEEQGLDRRNVLVSCRIDNPSLLLKAGMTGRAKIHCGQRPIIDLLTRRITHYLRIEFWSWW